MSTIHNPLAGTKYERAWGPGGGTHSFGQNWQSSWAWDLLHSSAGHPVYAPIAGVVRSVGSGGTGRFAGAKVGISGSPFSVFLTHMSAVYVKYNQHVQKGQLIGRTGQANGVYHLHFAMCRGDYHSPEQRGIDPKPYLDGSAKYIGKGPNGYPMYIGEDYPEKDKRTVEERLRDAGFGARSAEQMPNVLQLWNKAGRPKASPRSGDSALFRRLRKAGGFGVRSARSIVKALRWRLK